MNHEQIVFSSLLIGLMAGVNTVSVDTPGSPAIARIEFLLDGQAVATAGNSRNAGGAATRWEADIDFGRLSPHDLTAIAKDGTGREVDRASRLVNLPSPPARLEIALTKNELGQPVAVRLVASSIVRDRPLSSELTLDGASLVIDSSGQSRLPALDMRIPHVLSATAVFSDDVSARADVAVGGGIAEEAGSRLTAVPVRVQESALPSVESLAGAFRRRGVPLRVVAVERGRATVVLVRHPKSLEARRRLRLPTGGDPLKLESRDSVGFVWPITTTIPDGSERTTLFESTSFVSGSTGGFYSFLTRVSRPGSVASPFRFADAVAVAGHSSYAEGTRRAVILVEGSDRADASQFTPSEVREYLDRIGTPLHIWSLDSSNGSSWTNQPEDVASIVGLQSAMARLRKDLGSQAVVWVAGEFSPTEIELAETIKSVSMLARTAARD